MMMPSGDPLLLPVKPWFIGVSVLLALLLDMAGGMLGGGRAGWQPDLLALVLLFWVIHEPERVHIGTAFALGLVQDVHQAAWLGQHALVYSVLAFQAIQLQRRLLWFGPLQQAVQLLPLLGAAQAIHWGIRLLNGNPPGWDALLAPLLEALLWWPADWLLLAPQRQAHDPDDNRPL